MSEINVSVGGGPGVVVSVAGNGTTATVTTGGTVDVTLTETNPTWGGIAGKPSTFPPQAHNHFIADTVGLQAALDEKADLDAGGKVPSSQLPSYVDDVLEYANAAALPVTGETGKIYVTLDNGKVFRWGGSVYVEISAAPGSTDMVPEGTGNLYHTTARAAAAAPVQSVAGRTGAVVLAKADVGLGNVDNTADASKPVSTAQAAADAAVASAAAADATSKANAAQAAAVQRANHTGTQAIATVDGLQAALDGKVGTADSRLTDARTPTAHKASHATGGTDALTPADIGAAAASHTHTNLGTEAAKQDFYVNLQNGLPNIENGVPTEVNHRAIAWLQSRSHFGAGRFNHYGEFPAHASQYSATFGWACHCVDSTGASDGSGAKGSFAAGYGNVCGAPMSAAVGQYNLIRNTGHAIGAYNQVGGSGHQIIVHNWTSPTASHSVEVSGDMRTTYAVGTLVGLLLASAANVDSWQPNKVTAVSYDAGTNRTTITLRAPAEFQAATVDYLEAVNGLGQANVLTRSLICTLNGGGEGIAIGWRNIIPTSRGIAIGTDHNLVGQHGIALGRQVVTKNAYQGGFGTGYLMNGSTRHIAQMCQWCLKRRTTDATPAVMTIDGLSTVASTNSIILEERSVYRIRYDIAGRGTGDIAYGETITATVKRDGAGTVSIVGQASSSKHTDAGLSTASATLKVNSTLRSVELEVTGVAATTIIWHAYVEASQISNDYTANSL